MKKKFFEEAWKTATGPSVLSAFTPKLLTPTQKMMLARARIWGDLIGGNVSTGNKFAKGTFKTEGMIKYFDGGFPEFVFPYEMEDPDQDEPNDEVEVFREIRNSRKGKVLVKAPKRPLTAIPKYKAKRYLFVEKIRKEQMAKLNLTKLQMKDLSK